MLKKKSIILTFAIIGVLTFSFLVTPLHYALAQQGLDDNEDNITEEIEGNTEQLNLRNRMEIRISKLIEIMVKSGDHIQEIFAKLDEQGVEIPEEAEDRVETGLNKSQTAILLFEDGQLEEAGRTAIAALKDFKETIWLLRDIDLDDLPNADLRVGHAINRTKMFINRLEIITKRVGERGYNTTNLEENLVKAETILENATDLLLNGKVDSAARKLSEARTPISEIIRELYQITKKDRFRRINMYIDNSIRKLNEIEAKSDDLLPSPIANRIKDAVSRAKAHLDRTRNLLLQNRFSNAFDELEKMVIDSEEGHNLFPREIIR